MISHKRILAITLARGGSSRIPKKNIAKINGKTLLQYTTDAVKQSKYIDKYIVSTDDDEIIQVCRDLGVEYRLRPAHLATATAKTSDAMIDVVENIEPYHYVVEVMCTNPLKNVEDIDNCIQKLDQTGADSVVSVVRIYDHHPSRVKYIEDDRMVDFYPEILESRRQDLTPPAYVRNGSIYATTRQSLLATRVRLGKDTRPYIMPAERSINIDEPIDLELARLLIK